MFDLEKAYAFKMYILAAMLASYSIALQVARKLLAGLPFATYIHVQDKL